MALSDVKIDWNDKQYVRAVQSAAYQAAKDGADYVAEEAKRNLEKSAPGSTGTLASQIDIAPFKHKDGVGYGVVAQGSGNYQRFYASFVELGSRNNVALSYLRKALRRGRYYMRNALLKRLEADFKP